MTAKHFIKQQTPETYASSAHYPSVRLTVAGISYMQQFLAFDAFVRMNRRTIAMMFVHLSVCLFVWDGRAL